MSKEYTWEEALKEYSSMKRAEFEKTNGGKNKERLERDLNFIRKNGQKEKYEYYNPDNIYYKLGY